jgi:predicted RND superfamily exporter protein
MSIGVQSCLSESGSFIEDDNPEQLTVQSIDAIKLMADVEDDVRKQFVNQVKELEEELRKKQEVIEQLRTKNVKTVLTHIEASYNFSG